MFELVRTYGRSSAKLEVLAAADSSRGKLLVSNCKEKAVVRAVRKIEGASQ